jgi:C-terminal processing protease CtpA/Prc
MQISKALGMSLLNDELYRLIEAGKVEMAEAVSKAVDKEDLLRRYRTGLTLTQASPAADTFRVSAVAAGSPGANAGLARGDEIIELDGKPSQQFTLDEMKAAIRIDGKRNLTVVRDGKRVKLVMELGGRETPVGGAVAGAAARGAVRRPGA